MSARLDCFVSVVVRLSNHATILEAFVREVHQATAQAFAHFELILVDDASIDNPGAVLTPLLDELSSIRVLRLMRPVGYEASIAAGLDSAIGDYVVLLDPAADPPGLIPAIVEKARKTNQVVFGVDTAPSKESWHYRAALKAFYRFSRFFLNVELIENSTGFMAFNRQVLNAVSRFSDQQRFMRLFATLASGGGEAFPYQRLEHDQTARKSLREGFGKAIALLVQNSSRPLRLVSIMGLAASMINLLYIGYVAAVVLIKRDIAAGWVTLSLQSSFMFFIINLTLAVIAEYILRIMDESRDRPLYFLRDEQNSSVLLGAESRRNVVIEAAGHEQTRIVPAEKR